MSINGVPINRCSKALWYNLLHCIKFQQPRATGIHAPNRSFRAVPQPAEWNSQLTVDPQSSSALTGSSSLPKAAENQHAKVEMVFRFWGAGASPHHPGVLALIEDAVASKRGVFVSARDQLYVSGLKQPADALVVSRQVQLGLQGFRGTNPAGPVAVSIAIDVSGTATETKLDAQGDGDSAPPSSPVNPIKPVRPAAEPPHDLVTLLKLSKPAQILLTHDLCQQLAQIKGLPLKSFPGRFGVYEYLWTGEEKLDLLQSEPQLTLVAVPATSPAGPTKDKTSTTPAVDRRAKISDSTESHTGMVTEKPPALQSGLKSPRVLITGAVAAVVLVGAIGIGMHWAHGPSASSTPAQLSQPSPAQSVPAISAPATVVPPIPTQNSASAGKPHAAASRQASKPVAHQPAQAEEKPATPPAPAPSAPCTLGGNPERFVGLAEQARGRGDYANAIRIFREVLDCDPNNGAAREGLDKAMRGEQSQH